MTDDLHDIDDLFRNGIDGYIEEVPAPVWDAVDKELDRKQAALYKKKYYHVKRLALLLLLLCIISGAYVIFGLITNRQTATAHQKMIVTMPLPNEKTDSKLTKNTELHTNHLKPAPAAVEVNKTQEKNTENNNAVNSAPGSFTITKQMKSPANGFKKVAALADAFVHNDAANVAPTHNGIQHGKMLTNKQTEKPAKPLKHEVGDADSNFYLPPQVATSRYYNENSAGYGRLTINRLPLPAIQNNILLRPDKALAKKSKTKTYHELSLSAFAAPNFIFDRLEDDHHLAEPGRNREEAHRKEQKDITLSAGVLLNYALNKKLSIQSGAAITYSSTAIGPKTVYAKSNNGQINYELNCSSGNAYIPPKTGAQLSVGDSANASGTVSKLTYITVPAFINYHISMGRFSLLPAVGTGFNILLSGKAKTNLYNASGVESAATSISGLKPVYIDAQTGLGIEYDLSRKLRIGVRPNVHFGLMSINRETPVKLYQNYLSIETGLRLKL